MEGTEKEWKKLFIETYGCQMNVADSEVIASVMKMAGYDTTDNIDEADAIFLNTCSIRDNAEQKIWNRLEALAAMKKKRGGKPGLRAFRLFRRYGGRQMGKG